MGQDVGYVERRGDVGGEGVRGKGKKGARMKKGVRIKKERRRRGGGGEVSSKGDVV